MCSPYITPSNIISFLSRSDSLMFDFMLQLSSSAIIENFDFEPQRHWNKNDDNLWLRKTLFQCLPNENHFLVFINPLLKNIDDNLQWIDRSKGAWQTGHRTSQESPRRCKCRSTAQQCKKLCVLFHLKLLVLFKLNCNYRCL